MRQVILGKSGLKVSAVGFGGIPIQRLSPIQAARVVRAGLDLGVTFIDTAASYGDSEEKIGRAIAGRRDNLVLASKSANRTRDGMMGDIDRSRRHLGTETIDLYQLHDVRLESWLEISAIGGAMEALLEARRKGWINHIGFTSHSVETAMRLIEEPVFETVQFPFNLITREPGERLIPRARAEKLGFIVMKPLCGGQFEDAELAFRFLNAYPDLVPIPGIERAAEIRQIVAVVGSGAELSGKDRRRSARIVDELGKLFCRRCGYCMPCPEGVPIVLGMIFESFIKRMSPKLVTERYAGELIDKASLCTDCGQCQEKCPYDLPIRETIKRAAGLADDLLREYG
ncbi:MAG: aldo/keto reductase [Phycisphaerae bacterium]|jgi:hypothetical protein|nr:aldo/keto reductase [Phycisphaerae bacterium]